MLSKSTVADMQIQIHLFTKLGEFHETQWQLYINWLPYPLLVSVNSTFPTCLFQPYIVLSSS